MVMTMEAEQIDYLICGGCQKNFELGNITNFVRHKKFDCDEQNTLQGRRSKILLCKTCPQRFGTPWSLLQHAQNVHAMQIYLEQGDFSELSIKTVALPPPSSKENHPASVTGQFTTHNTLAFTAPKERLSVAELNATPVMIIQGANGENKLVRIEKPPQSTPLPLQSAVKKSFPQDIVTINSSSDGGATSKGVTLNQSPVMGQRIVGEQALVVKSSPMVVASVLKSPVSKITSANPMAVSVLQPKTTQPKIVNINPSQPRQRFLTVLPQPNRVPEKAVTIPKPSSVPVPHVAVSQAPRIPASDSIPASFPVQIPAEKQNLTPAQSTASHEKTLQTDAEINSAVLESKATASTTTATENNADATPSAPDILEIVRATTSGTNSNTSSPQKDSTTKAEEEEEEGKLCCDNQDCGVTLIPGTHKELEKCCSAVLPKKRKRHMAINHMPSSLRAKRRVGEEGDKYSVNVPSAARSFIIDIEHDEHDEDVSQSADELKNENDTNTKKNALQNQSPAVETKTKPEQSQGTYRERSVIIQPGSSIAIPVSLESFRRLVGGRRGGRIPVRFPSSSPMPISMHVAPTNSKSSPVMTEVDTKPVLTAEGTIQEEGEQGDYAEEKPLDQEQGGRRGKRRYPTSRPFKCTHCEQGFNQRIHLQKHQSKHTGIKPFRCGQCDYSTVEKSHLKVHIRVHTGEKPFKCTYCEYATAQNSTLKIHLRRHHDAPSSTLSIPEELFMIETTEEGEVQGSMEGLLVEEMSMEIESEAHDGGDTVSHVQQQSADGNVPQLMQVAEPSTSSKKPMTPSGDHMEPGHQL